MSIKTTIQSISILAFLFGVNASAKIEQPNEFYFTSDVYYVTATATDAVIEVGFVPGSREYTGSVNYQARNGTAASGPDYIGVTNTLSFSGMAPTKTFRISIPVGSLRQGNQTVKLSLSKPGALITRSNATVVIINMPALPTLASLQGNGTSTVSVASMSDPRLLQKSASSSDANWIVPQPVNLSNGRFSYMTVAADTAFYQQNTR